MYGTGLFLMLNTGGEGEGWWEWVFNDGDVPVWGRRMGRYTLKGSVAHSGSIIQWLWDQMGIIKDAKESEALAA